MAIVFDGKKVAKKIRENLKGVVESMKKDDIKPKLVSLVVDEGTGTKKYAKLKKKAAGKIGAMLEIRDFGKDAKTNDMIDIIEGLNDDAKTHGIMVQLPLPKDFSQKEQQEIISAIDRKKDVDGMKEISLFVPPVVKATLLAIKEASKEIEIKEKSLFVVVGAAGFVGSRIHEVLENMGYRVKGVDVKTKAKRTKIKEADVIVSVTGTPGVIKKNMVKKGAIVIDVGAPKGDVDKEVEEKAGFITPVPGGIGPLTVSFLLENLVEAAGDQS